MKQSNKLKETLMAIFIIDWRRLNTTKFWVGLWFTLCHPIYAWKYERNVYKSFLWRVRDFFTVTIPKYTPFCRASRWITYNLIHTITDTKFLNTFYCRKNGDYTTYYSGQAWFGHFVVYELYWRHQGRGYAKKPRKTKLFSGWCWRKKTAINLYKKIVVQYPNLYESVYQPEPAIANPWVMYIVNNMYDLLNKVKPRVDLMIDSQPLYDRYKQSKDEIEKLWCYVLHLLSCPADFYNHYDLAIIFRSCDNYLYYKEMKNNPMIDYTYRLTLEKRGEKEAKMWLKECIADNSKEHTKEELFANIEKLAKFYRDQPFSYERI